MPKGTTRNTETNFGFEGKAYVGMGYNTADTLRNTRPLDEFPMAATQQSKADAIMEATERVQNNINRLRNLVARLNGEAQDEQLRRVELTSMPLVPMLNMLPEHINGQAKQIFELVSQLEAQLL